MIAGPQEGDRRRRRLRQVHLPQPGHGRRAPHRPPIRRHPAHHPHQRRNRHRQGADGPGHPRLLQPRKKQPLVSVNCASIPENLAESELFGYKKGAFTGAYADSPGKFLLADHGTILLDEIGELPAQHPGQAAARPGKRRDHPAEEQEPGPGRYPRPGRHQQGPGRRGPAEALPRRPLLPHRRAENPDPAAARPESRHHPAGRPFPAHRQPGQSHGASPASRTKRSAC